MVHTYNFFRDWLDVDSSRRQLVFFFAAVVQRAVNLANAHLLLLGRKKKHKKRTLWALCNISSRLDVEFYLIFLDQITANEFFFFASSAWRCF